VPLANYSFQFGTASPFFFGAGTPYAIINEEGLAGLPPMRVQDDDRGYNDGMYSGRDFYSGRTITLTIHTFAGNGLSASQNFELLKAALIPQQQGTTPLYFQLSNTDTTKVIQARVRSRTTPIDPEYTFGFIRSQINLFCPDPRYFDDTIQTLSLSPQPFSGRTYNRTYPLTYGAGSNTNTGTIINNGRVTTYPSISITGPAILPSITNLTTNQTIQINYSLVLGDTMVVDLDAKQITLNGSAARNLLANGSQWFGCGVGNSTISFNASGTTAGVTTITATYQSAYI
jgi:phage-related protein